MKLKGINKLFKRASSVLLSALLIATSLPISTVYAKNDREVSNQGTSTNYGKPTGNGTNDFGGHKESGVRAYIYDKDTGEFLTSESDNSTYNGVQAIDFLGINGNYQFYQNNVSDEDIDTNTIFGSIDKLTVSPDWPFEDNYFDKYVYAENSAGEVLQNDVISGTKSTSDWLKEDNGKRLQDIIQTYWGNNIAAIFQTSESLCFCIEPIFIISEAYGDETEDENAYPNHFQSGTQTKVREDVHTEITVWTSEDGDEVNHQDNYNYWRYVGPEHIIPPADGASENWFYKLGGMAKARSNRYDNFYTYYDEDNKAHYGLYDTYSFNEIEGTWLYYALIDEADNASYTVDHYDLISWIEAEYYPVPLYRGFKYAYGTARNIYERDIEGAEFAGQYTIEDGVCDAVYVGQVGDNGMYNNDYNLIFPDDPNAETPTYQGNTKCLEIGGVPTTWGLFMLCSVEFGGITFQTNNPLTSTPSHMTDPDSIPTRINYTHNGGFKNILKIYEDRNSQTGKLIKASSYFTSGAPSIMEILDESTDQWLPIECSEHEGKQCRKSWFNWYKKHSDEGYILDGDNLFLKGSGYTTSDWCVLAGLPQTDVGVKNQMNIAAGLSGSEYKTVVKAYENQGAYKTNTGVGNKHYVSMNDNDNILVIRYVKYSDGITTNLFNYDSVLTESQLTSVAKLDSTINDFKLGSKMFQANALSGDNLVDNSLSLGIGVDLHNESKYLDSILGYESVQHSATRPNTNLYKQSIGGNGVSIGITRRQSDSTGSDIVGISDVSVTAISKDGKTVINEKGSDMSTSGINSLFSTTRGNVASVETPSDNTLNSVVSDLTTSADMNTETINDVTLESGSLDPWTSDNDGNVSIADLQSGADKTQIKDGVQYRNANSSINVSTIKQNNSQIAGSCQTNTVMMGIQPLIKMGYTSLENNSYKTGTTLVATNNIREIAVNSYAGITYLNSVDIIVDSNTWAIDNILTNGDKAWNNPNSVLKGGSIVTLGTSGKSNTINIYSAQLVNDGSDYSNSSLVSYSEDCSLDTVKSYHEEYKNSVIDSLKQTYLTQWLSNNTSNTSTPAYEDSGAVKVSGLENDDFYNESNGYSNTNPFNSGGLELQPDSKYWLNSSSENKADSGRFDVTSEKTTYKYFKFVCNYDGRVYMLTSNEPEFKNPTVSLLLESNQGYSDLKNEDALRIDQQTNILQNMLNTAIRHQGADSGNESWSSLNDGSWYNEVLSATVIVQNTAVDIGINMPNKRMHVIDTSLEPYSESKLDQGTTALKTCWSTNWKELQALGKFRGVDISLDKAMQMFKSRNTYICNMSVQDN